MKTRLVLIFVSVELAAACGPSGSAPTHVVTEDPSAAPLAGLSEEESDRHTRGDVLFERGFQDGQGLGPVYIRPSCASCHQEDARGPGAVQRMVVVGADGFTQSADQSALPYGTVVRPQFTAGATRGVLPPDGVGGLKLSLRSGPATYGRGWMEAVDDAEILRLEAEQAQGGRVSGRVNRLADGSIGRFGVKARLATLDQFAADAFRGDMGLTSPGLPDEVPNPDGLTDDLKPGVDLAAETVSDVAFYVRTLALPRRGELSATGAELFERVGCADCHAPALRTRADFPVRTLAGATARVYTDMLLHDMGPALADGLRDGSATEREWRTAPLMGVRFARAFLHDGRAHTLEEAVAAHRDEGSEASFAVDAFDALEPAERDALIDFVSKL